MGSLLRGARQLGRVLLVASVLSTAVSAIEIDLCASFNTADMSRSTFFLPRCRCIGAVMHG